VNLPAEHIGLVQLARTADISVSALITACVDQHWQDR
jgi:hypothetical protein